MIEHLQCALDAVRAVPFGTEWNEREQYGLAVLNQQKWGSCLSTVAPTGCVLRFFGWLLKADTSLAVLRRHFPVSDRKAILDGVMSCG